MSSEEPESRWSRDAGSPFHPAVDVTAAILIAGGFAAAGHLFLPDLIFAPAVVLFCLLLGYLSISIHFPINERFLDRAPSVPVLAVLSLPLFGLALAWLHTRSMLSLASAVFALLTSVSVVFLGALLWGYRTSNLLTSSRRFTMWFFGLVMISTIVVGWFLFFVDVRPLVFFGFVEFLVVALYLVFVVPLASYQRRFNLEEDDLEPPYPELSVVVPAYNESGYVSECIESLISASYPLEHLEIIVVDDGSTDDTYDEAAQYRDSGVKVFTRENGGRHSAVNYGLHCATGEYVVVMDSDSVLVDGGLTNIVATLEANPGLGGVAGNIKVGNRDRLLTRLQSIEYLLGIHTFRRACSLFGSVPIAPGCLSGFRREAIEDAGGYSPDTVTEDFDLTVGLNKNGWEVRQIDATALTEAPFTIRDLYTQRVRWYSGGFQNLMKHSDVFAEADSGYLHRLVFPLFVFRMFVMPFAHVVILWTIGSLLFSGQYLPVLAFLAVSAVAHGLLALLAVNLGNDDPGLLPYGAVILFGYKQFLAAMMLISMTKTVFLGSDMSWGQITREKQTQSGTLDGQASSSD